MSNTPSPYLDIPRPRAEAAIRLFCFHHAGGGSSLFRPWAAGLASYAEVVLVELPGRENRRDEPLKHSLDEVIDELLPAIVGLLDKPCVLFGHSMGALLVLELARRLQAAGQGASLKKLFFSACHPPHLPRRTISQLPDAEFLRTLESMGGTPANVLAHADLMAMFLPILRADFSICESSSDYPAPLLSCPIVVYGGIDDAISLDDLASWRRYGGASFQMKLFPGSHFYLKTHRSLVLRNLQIDL